jgi:hypothetical protein
MADHELVVLSRPPAGVTDDEYDSWYDTHVREVLGLPGFVAAQRLHLEFVSATTEPATRFTFLTRYEIDGSFDDAWRALRAAVDGGRMTFCDWFGGVESQGWRGTPVRRLVASAMPAGPPPAA